MLERLQKILAASGIASRRKCEEIIAAGRVRIDGKQIKKMGAKADPEKSVITVDGNPLKSGTRIYYLLNKPARYICTTDDPLNRPTVLSLLPRIKERVFPIGRLDEDTEGLLIITNDGDLANILTHPRFRIRKTYTARVRGRITREAIQELKDGVYLPGGKAIAEEISIHRHKTGDSVVTLVVREGRNHIVRKMLARVGFPVKNLKRTRIEFLTLHKLSKGAHRTLTAREISLLRALAQRKLSDAPAKHPKPQPKKAGSRRDRASAASKPKPAARPKPKAKPRTTAKPKARLKTKPRPKAKPRTTAKPKARLKTKPRPKARPRPQPRTRPKRSTGQ